MTRCSGQESATERNQVPEVDSPSLVGGALPADEDEFSDSLSERVAAEATEAAA